MSDPIGCRAGEGWQLWLARALARIDGEMGDAGDAMLAPMHAALDEARARLGALEDAGPACGASRPSDASAAHLASLRDSLSAARHEQRWSLDLAPPAAAARLAKVRALEADVADAEAELGRRPPAPPDAMLERAMPERATLAWREEAAALRAAIARLERRLRRAGRCPRCRTECPAGAPRCARCGAPLASIPRGQG